MQLGVVVGMDRFLHPLSEARQKKEIARDKKMTTSWDSFWGGVDASGTIRQPSLPYPGDHKHAVYNRQQNRADL